LTETGLDDEKCKNAMKVYPSSNPSPLTKVPTAFLKKNEELFFYAVLKFKQSIMVIEMLLNSQ